MSMILGYIKEREISFLFFLLLVLLVIVLWNLYKKEKKRAEAAELSVAGERKKLRKAYLVAIRKNLRGSLNRIDIQNKDGSIENLGEKYGKKLDKN